MKFGVFEADLAARELRKNGVKLRLQDQPFQVLALLLENRGQVVTREELRQKLWPADTFVDFDNGLNTAINKIREALCDSAEKPKLIETLPRRGYRFVGAIETKTSRIQSLAVLPLENLTHDPDQEYFVDGLTEALITNLAKISALRVVSRTSVMLYKGVRKPLGKIAEELGVDAVVEGTVWRSGERVRISAQLIQATTDAHLWAESYEHDLRDMLALQSEVARAIAREIQVKVTSREQDLLARTRPVDPQAYEDYLKGRYHWNKRTLEGLTKGGEYFQRAIDLDPTYAAAYAGLADSASRLGFWTDAPAEEACARGKAAALRALEMDNTLTEAYAGLGYAYLHYDFNIPAAEEAVERALELDPYNAIAIQQRGLCLAARGQAEDALADLRRAVQLEPLNVHFQWNTCMFLYFSRRYDEAIALCHKALELDPQSAALHQALGVTLVQRQFYEKAVRALEEAVQISRRAPFFLGQLGHIYGIAGRKADALKLIGELAELSKRRHVSPYWSGMIYAALNQKDDAFLWLERAFEDHAPWMAYVKGAPWFDNLRPDPRFYSLLQRMKIPI